MVRFFPPPPEDDDRYRYKDHLYVKIELTSRLKPIELNELINQGHTLFISKFLGSEKRYKHDEVGYSAQ